MENPSTWIQTDGYSIVIGSDALSIFDSYLKEHYSGCKKIILVDENTRQHCLPFLEIKNTELLEIESGEENKNIHTCAQLWKNLINLKAERDSLLINLGGGVVCDIGGFTASTFKRGIDFVHIPTTLLAQADASLGGKTGVDVVELKNQVGVFSNPKAVFIFPQFLDTLDELQLRSGFAEIIKHALIRDKILWNVLQSTDFNNVRGLEDVISRSLQIKNDIVMKDPFEKGLRRILNFGHTIGHAVESVSLMQRKNQLLHGEAVAIGMICEAYLSYKINGLAENELHTITKIILSIFKSYSLSKEQNQQLIGFMQSDKKNKRGEFHFTLLKTIGEADIDHSCSQELIVESLDYYRKRSAESILDDGNNNI